MKPITKYAEACLPPVNLLLAVRTPPCVRRRGAGDGGAAEVGPQHVRGGARALPHRVPRARRGAVRRRRGAAAAAAAGRGRRAARAPHTPPPAHRLCVCDAGAVRVRGGAGGVAAGARAALAALAGGHRGAKGTRHRRLGAETAALGPTRLAGSNYGGGERGRAGQLARGAVAGRVAGAAAGCRRAAGGGAGAGGGAARRQPVRDKAASVASASLIPYSMLLCS